MRMRSLGPLEVPVVGLGCNNFGGRIDEAATQLVVDAALDAGVTFFDTADVYGARGGSETILGNVLQGRRDQVVLARATTSAARSRRRSGASRRTSSTSTSTTGPIRAHRSRRRSARWTSS